MTYIYEGHLGSLYATEFIDEDTYCEQCGGSDWLLGEASTREEAWDLLKDTTDIDLIIGDECTSMIAYNELRHGEFLSNLHAAANGRKFKSKTWVNYPNSIFYYWEDEEPNGNNEIGIYTGLKAWGIYI